MELTQFSTENIKRCSLAINIKLRALINIGEDDGDSGYL